MSDQTPCFPPRSDHVPTRGVIFFARLLDKIRLHAAGRLPTDYNLGFNRPDTFDARFCRFWGVDFDALTARTLAGGSDEEIFDATFAGRQPFNDEHVRVWNGFLAKRGWRDEASAELADNKRALGFSDRDDILTYVDLHDADEGRQVQREWQPEGTGSFAPPPKIAPPRTEVTSKPPDPVSAQIITFLREIGLTVTASKLPMPGIQIQDGGLLIDETQLLHPGDLLHEAGHLAVKPADKRARTGANAGKNMGEEIAAICWSYAALSHLGLDPAVVFHPAGYKGGAQSLIDNFTQGFHPGLPLLQWMGLTFDEKNASTHGVPSFPHMVRWLRE